MEIAVNLISETTGEIKRFLEDYYGKRISIDEDVDRWTYVYNKPLESVDIISVFMDNSDSYDISLCIDVNTNNRHYITDENHNDIIKDIFSLFYEDTNNVSAKSN